MRTLTTGALLMLVTGCGDLLPDVEITGSMNIVGPEPAALKFEVYSAIDNSDAFNTDFCDNVDTESTCYGRVRMDDLGNPVAMDEAQIDGKDFVLSGIEADIGYLLIVSSDDPDVLCDTDIVGTDAGTKVVTEDSAIKIELSGGLKTYELPRKVKLTCFEAGTDPDVPDQEDPQVPDNDEDIQPPAVVDWDVFTISGKNGNPEYADASNGSVISDLPCDDTFPSVLEVNGEIANTDEAFIRIQFGSGANATYRTVQTEIVNGKVKQEISLTGGYAVVQLDTNDQLDGNGESYTVAFCEPTAEPVQEFTMLLSWDSNDTDVDSHVFSGGEEIAYYNMRTSFGELDIDDIDGYGPETITSKPGLNGETYDVRVHYYSDHGNGSTTATARIIYADPTGGVCDVTVSQSLDDDDWWDVGTFGPGLCP